jgi:hypothetical protein
MDVFHSLAQCFGCPLIEVMPGNFFGITHQIRPTRSF